MPVLSSMLAAAAALAIVDPAVVKVAAAPTESDPALTRRCVGNLTQRCRADSLSDYGPSTPWVGPIAFLNGVVYRVNLKTNIASPLMSVREMAERMDRCEVILGSTLPKCLPGRKAASGPPPPLPPPPDLPDIDPDAQDDHQLANRPCLGIAAVLCRADSLDSPPIDATTPQYGPLSISHGMFYQVDDDLNVARPIMSLAELRRRMDRCESVFGLPIHHPCHRGRR